MRRGTGSSRSQRPLARGPIAPYDELLPDGTMPPELEAEFEAAWQVIEKQGVLHTAELPSALSVCGFTVSEEELVDLVDPRVLRSIKLSRADFLQIYLRMCATGMSLETSVQHAFSMYDEDRDGRLPATDVRRALARVGGESLASRTDALFAALGRTAAVVQPGPTAAGAAADAKPEPLLDVSSFASALRASLEDRLAFDREHGLRDEEVRRTLELDEARRAAEERARFGRELGTKQSLLRFAVGRQTDAEGIQSAVSLSQLGALQLGLRRAAVPAFVRGRAELLNPPAAERTMHSVARALLLLNISLAEMHPEIGTVSVRLEVAPAAEEGEEVETAGGHALVLARRRASALRALLVRHLVLASPARSLPPAEAESLVGASRATQPPDGATMRAMATRASPRTSVALMAGPANDVSEEVRVVLMTPRETAAHRAAVSRGEVIDAAGADEEDVGSAAAAEHDAEGEGAAARTPRADAEEAAAYARRLDALQPELERRLGASTPLIAPELGALRLSLTRHFEFEGDAAEYLALEAGLETVTQLARAVACCNGLLAEHDLSPLYLSLEGHTANREPAEYNEALSKQRAARVAADLEDALLRDGTNRLTRRDVEARPSVKGLGGSVRLERRVDVRIMTPAEARAHQAASSASARAAAAERARLTADTAALAAEQQSYATSLRDVQQASRRRLRAHARLAGSAEHPADVVEIDLSGLRLSLLRPVVFESHGTRFAEPEAARATLEAAAAAIGCVHAACAERGLEPATVAVEVHADPADASEPQALARAAARAARARAELAELLLRTPSGVLTRRAEADRRLLASALRGAPGRPAGTLELRVLSPTAARAAAERAEEERARALEAERSMHAQHLATVQREIEEELGGSTPLVQLQLGALSVGLKRQFEFKGDEAEYVDAVAEAPVLEQLAATLSACNRVLASRRAEPLFISLEGHTANREPRAFNEELSLRRAERVRQDLVERMLALEGGLAEEESARGGAGAGGAGSFGQQRAEALGQRRRELSNQFAVVGHGGELLLRREVLVHIMTPSEVERHKASDAFRGVASLPTLQLSSRKSTAGPTGADGSDGGGAGDFRGSWQLSSSRGQDEFLRALGVGPLKRKLAASHRSVQAWERLPSGEWTFTVDTPHGPKTEHLAVDRTLSDEVDGVHLTKRSGWEKGALVTRAHVPDASAHGLLASDLTLSRTVQRGADGASELVVQIDAEIDSRVHSCTRIFHRYAGPAPTHGAGAGAAAAAAPLAITDDAGVGSVAPGAHSPPLKSRTHTGTVSRESLPSIADGSESVPPSPGPGGAHAAAASLPVSDLEVPKVPDPKGGRTPKTGREYTRSRAERERKEAASLPVSDLEVPKVPDPKGGRTPKTGREYVRRKSERETEHDAAFGGGGAGAAASLPVTDLAVPKSPDPKGGRTPKTGREYTRSRAERERKEAASLPVSDLEVPKVPDPKGGRTPKTGREYVRRKSEREIELDKAFGGGSAGAAASLPVTDLAEPKTPDPQGSPTPKTGRVYTRSRAERERALGGADARADFAGVWVLVGSSNFDEYLAAMGVSWAKRRAALQTKPEQTWRPYGETGWRVETRGSANPLTPQVELVVEGDAEELLEGVRVRKRTYYEGGALITSVSPADEAAKKALEPLIMRRYVRGSGDDLRLVLEMTYGETTAVREFAPPPRASPAAAAAAPASK